MAPVGTELPIRKVLGVGQSPGARGMESPHTRSRSSGIPAPGSPQSEQGRWGGLPCGILGRKPCTVWRGKEGRCRRGQEDPGGPRSSVGLHSCSGRPEHSWAWRRSAAPCAPPSLCPHKRALSAVIHLGPAARCSLSFKSPQPLHGRFTVPAS